MCPKEFLQGCQSFLEIVEALGDDFSQTSFEKSSLIVCMNIKKNKNSWVLSYLFVPNHTVKHILPSREQLM